MIVLARARSTLAALDAAGAPGPASIGLILADDAELAGLNATHMGKDGPTDVLSFPLLPPEAFPTHARAASGSGPAGPGATFALPPGRRPAPRRHRRVSRAGDRPGRGRPRRPDRRRPLVSGRRAAPAGDPRHAPRLRLGPRRACRRGLDARPRAEAARAELARPRARRGPRDNRPSDGRQMAGLQGRPQTGWWASPALPGARQVARRPDLDVVEAGLGQGLAHESRCVAGADQGMGVGRARLHGSLERPTDGGWQRQVGVHEGVVPVHGRDQQRPRPAGASDRCWPSRPGVRQGLAGVNDEDDVEAVDGNALASGAQVGDLEFVKPGQRRIGRVDVDADQPIDPRPERNQGTSGGHNRHPRTDAPETGRAASMKPFRTSAVDGASPSRGTRASIR